MGAGAQTAAAHPLGNFSINQYHELVMRPDQLMDSAILDVAEIPTLQAEQDVDTDHDGEEEPAEMTANAARVCGDLGRAVRAQADGARTLAWRVDRAVMEYRPGTAGLRTSRFTCELSAAVRMRTDGVLNFSTGYLTDRLGWREITARGEGVAVAADVPTRSVSGGLQSYPRDMLTDPLDMRSARIRLGAVAAAGSRTPSVATGGWAIGAERAVAGWDRSLVSVAGARRLTVPLGAAAVLLAVLLGAMHAALPGHGKTMMAACLAGRRRSVREAVMVAASVAFAHTGGVLAMGLLLTASVHFAADQLMRWLTLISGLMVVTAGAAMLRGAVRRRRSGAGGHDHGTHGHDDRDGHDHGVDGHNHSGHDHRHHRGHAYEPNAGRGAVIGMAAAGGLVPSPTALVVLLGTVALGRTVFGVVLVIAYGLGMAATLTAAGLLAAATGRRLPSRLRAAALYSRVHSWTPTMTASVVVLVGIGLTVRASSGLV